MADVNATHATTGATPPGGAFPPFQTNTFVGQLIWFAIAFGLLYYMMSKIALPRVGAVLHERSERIARDLGEAQALRTQSEEAGAAYEASLTLARDKARGIAQQTRDALAAETEEKRKALEAGLAERLASSEAAIRSKTADAMSNVRGIAPRPRPRSSSA
jgi:F-type H+-transporting ATPase subunit b